ncbi:hypothetical protein FNV43_RR17167 [Rhamnella rubrinervis]|uniref:Uncharacterized protein n=1 Tax=Rhamnella rubrinervis TaxID=2594499 RepID=A0A8K0E8V6_9ROSA|nr:hypothetical protein FNV43_RR17167 [Rhamnella rubrinervis]
MRNGWRYLIRLIVLSEKYRLEISMPIFLHFFYLKLGEEGLELIFPCITLNIIARLPTNSKQNNVIDVLQRIEENNLHSLLSEEYFRAVSYWQIDNQALEAGPSKQQAENIAKGTPLTILEVPYTHVLEGCIRLLYSEPTDPL